VQYAVDCDTEEDARQIVELRDTPISLPVKQILDEHYDPEIVSVDEIPIPIRKGTLGGRHF
jgi:hypothetical protein